MGSQSYNTNGTTVYSEHSHDTPWRYTKITVIVCSLLGLYGAICALTGTLVLAIGLGVLCASHYKDVHFPPAHQVMTTGSVGGTLALLAILFSFNLRLVEVFNDRVQKPNSRYRTWLLVSVVHSKVLALAFGVATGYFGTAVYGPDGLSAATGSLCGLIGSLVVASFTSLCQCALLAWRGPPFTSSFLYIDVLTPGHLDDAMLFLENLWASRTAPFVPHLPRQRPSEKAKGKSSLTSSFGTDVSTQATSNAPTFTSRSDLHVPHVGSAV